ncbi:hypothetical protein [Piscinibacter koreensis]|uniref:Uncharacterized protein n=1 Tax=Piscinibacter koreensis TaxID=2742824 RepID=A0A7Y6NR62_9BURK|nr:hypothetical protein [Schlegelella koreensis]NUZ07781.1 hypothetical protein [Schlegelella koreensis]
MTTRPDASSPNTNASPDRPDTDADATESGSVGQGPGGPSAVTPGVGGGAGGDGGGLDGVTGGPTDVPTGKPAPERR